VAVARAVARVTGLRVDIKWPNDLEVAGRKCGGILTEMNAEPDRVRYAVLGVGLDVNQVAEDWPDALRKTATSLRMAAGRSWDRAELAVEVLRDLDADYRRLQHGVFEEIADEWESACSTLGRNVTIRIGERRVRGRAESLDSDGALLVRTEHGHLERITGGDVVVDKT
jgi:BirA family biotin operon repressor/biotin-[acetyl-CoA-carboxylase] ligase